MCWLQCPVESAAPRQTARLLRCPDRPALGLAAAEGAQAVRIHDSRQGLKANFYRVDTCAAEFEAYTPYLYSTYEQE